MTAQEKYILRNLSDFPEGFRRCVVRAYQQVVDMEGFGEALPMAVMLYIAAKRYNLPAEICMGLIKVQGYDTYAAWCKVNGIIIDPAVFGLTNYYKKLPSHCSFLSRISFLPDTSNLQFLPMVTPFIGTESSAVLQNLSYQEGEFDESWNGADVKWALGALIATYLVDAPFNILMERLSEILGEKHDREFEEEIYNLIGLDRIGSKVVDTIAQNCKKLKIINGRN